MEPRISMDFKGAFWPAPVNLITVGIENPNIFTLGIVGAPCSRPPILTISVKPHRYSYQLLKAAGQFVVNFPTAEMVDQMWICGTRSGREIDKWKACGFTPVKGAVVDVPSIAECPVNIECTVEQEILFQHPDGREGSHIGIIGRIVHLGCHQKYIVDGKLQWDLIDPIFRTRPGTWRALGAVLGYDARAGAPNDPRLAPEPINQRTAHLSRLYNPNA